MFLKRRKNSIKAKTGTVLLAIEEIRFHDKVRVSNTFFYVSTISISWYGNLKGEFQNGSQ